MKILRNKKRGIRILKGFFFLLTFNFILFTLHSVANASALTRPANNLGLVGYWSMDDGRGAYVTDSSGSGNTGTLNGDTSWINGKRGKALALDGSGDNVALGSSTTVLAGLQLPLTISGWFKQNTTTGLQSIYAAYQSGASHQLWSMIRIDNGTFRYYMSNTDTTYQYFGTFEPSVNNWHHFSVVVSGSLASPVVTIYLDGSSQESSGLVALSATPDTSVPIYIGTNATGNNETFNGVLDEIRVYSRALSATEVATLYNSGASKVNTSQNTVAPENLVFWHTFDGVYLNTTTSTDRSGQGNNGTLSGGPVPAQGKVGQSLKFDGTDDYVGVPLGNPPTTAITLSAWIKPAAFTGDILEAGSNWGYAYYYNGTIEAIIAGSRFEGTSVLPFNQWAHVVMTYDSNGTGSKIYVNGVDDGGTPYNGTSTLSATGVNIGRINMEGYFNGSIDDARIYNKALSAAEVAQLYNSNSVKTNVSVAPTASSGLVLWHTFDGQYLNTTTSTDRSGNSNNGTLSGGPVPAQGKTGQALRFDGSDDNVSVVDTTSTDFGENNFTLSFWAKTIISSGYGAVAGKAFNPDVPMYYILIQGSDGALDFRVTGTAGAGLPDTVRGSGFNDGNWHHGVMVVDRDNDILRIYKDGVQAGTDVDISSVTGSVSPAAPFAIGQTSEQASYPFPGTIDDVRAYNRALSASEVLQLYNLGK